MKKHEIQGGRVSSADRLVRRVTSWAMARELRLNLRRQMDDLRCEYSEPSDPETGYPGIPRCYQGSEPTNDWCEPCRRRDDIYRGAYSCARRSEHEHFRLLCAMAARSVKRQQALCDVQRAESTV